MAWTRRSSKHRRLIPVVSLLAIHGAFWLGAPQNSPTIDEVNHLPAGVSHLYLGRFDLYRVNPPLVRTVAALPIILMSPTTNWGRYDTSPIARPDLEVSRDFLKGNGPQRSGILHWPVGCACRSVFSVATSVSAGRVNCMESMPDSWL